MFHMKGFVTAVRLALSIAFMASVYTAAAQDTERRLEEFGCVLRLPDPDFTWLAEGEIPGATLACRDTKDRFVMLIVVEAPPGYHIDARQGAAYEKGMDLKSDGIERLSGKLTEFLGVPCYEIRGRIRADQSLTLTRMFAANGFHYNLQAMIPAAPDGQAGKFDDLFAAFRFIGSPVVPGPGEEAGTTRSEVVPPGAGNQNVDARPSPGDGFGPDSPPKPPTPADAEVAPLRAADPSLSFAYWTTRVSAVVLVAAIIIGILVGTLKGRR